MKTVKIVILAALVGIAGQAMAILPTNDDDSIAWSADPATYEVSSASAAIYNGDLESLKSMVEANPSILTVRVPGFSSGYSSNNYLVDYAGSLIIAKVNPALKDTYQNIYNYLQEKTPK